MFSTLLPHLFIVIYCFILVTVNGLYEDQIGKFDWKRNYVGKVVDLHLEGWSNERIIVATEENVLAALSTKTGDILWRQIFEKNDRGKIKLLHVEKIDPVALTTRSNDDLSPIITVSGWSPSLIRGWEPITGNLVWEWSLQSIDLSKSPNAIWFVDNHILYHVIPVWSSHLEVTGYHPSTGQQVKSTTTRIAAMWITDSDCSLNGKYFVCTVNDRILAVDLVSDSLEIITKILNKNNQGKSKLLKGSSDTIIIGDQLLSLASERFGVSNPEYQYFSGSFYTTKNVLYQVSVSGEYLKIILIDSDTNKMIRDTVFEYPVTLSRPNTIHDVYCNVKSDLQLACVLLLTGESGEIVMLRQGKVKWIREEALANIVAIEMIDLPLGDSEGTIEDEFNNKDGDVIGSFIRRITSQIIQVRNLILTVMGLGQPPSASEKAGLIRDAFGLHKMIVVGTGAGKLFGVDNISGRIHWMKNLNNFDNFNKDQGMQLLIQRTTRHFPYDAQCVLIGKNKKNNNGIMYQFNPISGQAIGNGEIQLNYMIKQATVLHRTSSDFLKGILLLDHNNQAHVIPESASEMANGVYLYTADKSNAQLSGFYVKYDKKLKTIPTYTLSLSGQGNAHEIIAFASKNPIEHVHSQGRVLGDRSVLYKYINPNLIAVGTLGPDSVHKTVLNIHLIDVVSGAIISSITHRKARGPLHMIHSENWIAYTYYNDKIRRTEITTMELYEGKSQANSTVWSSLDAPPLPIVEKQSYILPANVVSLKETITERGITNKNVLLGLSSGAVIELPWAYLDPRRPILTSNQPREEGAIPYIPELQLPSENVINYNQPIGRIKGIYTAPSGLESTCLVFCYGLDIFVSRVSPSKTFDLLKDDFDYFLISIVLIALSITSIVVKHLSARKILKQAWK